MSARLAVIAMLLAIANSVFAQETTAIDARAAVPRPLVLVSPDYPARALFELRTAELQVTGKVTNGGMLESPVFSSKPGEEDFVEAVRSVVKFWRFIPGVDEKACAAVPLDAKVTVWFEIKDSRPAIFVSMPSADDAKTTPRILFPWDKFPRTQYPRRAVEKGIDGIAYVLIRASKSGEILHSEVLASSPLRDFGDAALRGLQRAAYKPFDAGASDSLCGVVEYFFCIQDGANYPMSHCQQRRQGK